VVYFDVALRLDCCCSDQERCKIHDLLIEGVELALKKRGYPALADMKAKWQRKER